MESSKFGMGLVVSLVCIFAFVSIQAESAWLEPIKETTIKWDKVSQQVLKIKDTSIWNLTTVQDIQIKQSILLAQVKSPTERKKEAELEEKAALKRLEALKKKIEQRKQAKREKKQAEIKKAHEQKLKEEGKLEEVRKLKLKENARLAAERKAMQERHVDEFIKSIGSHPCSEYDVNNKKQVKLCLEKLEATNIKKDDRTSAALPSVWVEQGTCKVMKENLAEILRSIGFSKAETDKRLPSCKIFAELLKETKGVDVYWSGCVDPPQRDVKYIFNCLNFSKNYFTLSQFPGAYNRNLKAAGHIGGSVVVNRYAKGYDRKIWQEVDALRRQRNEKIIADKNLVIKNALFKRYYEETPERGKTKFSQNERKLMNNGKLVVPSSYALPSAEEIRLAVMRSIVDRTNVLDIDTAVVGRGILTSWRSNMTDGNTLYLIIKRRGMPIIFGEAKNAKCRKRTNQAGFMCNYKLQVSASGLVGRELSDSGGIINHDWFILTDRGWRQPFTQEQSAEHTANDERVNRKIQQRRARRYNNVSFLDGAAQEVRDGLYIDGLLFGAMVKKIRSGKIGTSGKGMVQANDLIPIKNAIYDIYSYRDFRGDYGKRDGPFRYWKQVESMKENKVLKCQYATGEKGTISRGYYFWHKQVPANLDTILKSQLLLHHPIHKINSPLDKCPESQPADKS